MAALRMALLGGMLSCLAGCSMERTELARTVSPDHQTTAILIREFGGGAAGASAYYLYFVSSQEKENLKHPTLTASGCDQLSIAWTSSHMLQMNYSGCAIRQFENHWISDFALHHLQAPNVEIVLARLPDRELARQ